MYDREAYLRNREARLASSKKWQQANRAKVMSTHRAWRERNPEKAKEQSKRWRNRNPEKRHLYYLAKKTETRYQRRANANAARKIPAQPCEMCGKLKIHRHHEDYSRPLMVRFLCPRHHKLEHLNASP